MDFNKLITFNSTLFFTFNSHFSSYLIFVFNRNVREIVPVWFVWYPMSAILFSKDIFLDLVEV